MAYSRINYVGNGSQTQFAINFPLGFLTRSDVTCYVIGEVDGLGNQVYRTLTWINDGLVQVSGTAPDVDATVVFERTVDKETLIHDYSDGSAIIEENLDQSNKQNIMLMHEVLDGRFGVLADDIDMGQHTVKNLVDPVDDQDAVNLRFFMDNNASENKLAAAAAQAAAEQAEANAELAEANAEAAAATAAADVASTLAGYVTSAQAAKAAAELAETNAETAEVNAVAAQVAAEAARDESVIAVGGIKITNADTTAAKANDKIVVSGSLTKTVLNPGANEQLQLGFDMSSTNSAISALSSQVDTLKTNLAMTIIRLIANAGSSYMGMVDGWADEFEDTAGIGALGTATYDATGDYIHNPGGYTADVVPVMTSNTAPSGVVTTSPRQAGSGYECFDGSLDQDNNYTYLNTIPAYIAYQATSAKVIQRYSILPQGAFRWPTSWQFQGSNDGSNWTTLHTVTNEEYATWTGRRYYSFSNATAYLHHRLYMTAGSHAPYIMITDFEMMEAIQPPNSTVASIIKTADASPSHGRVTLVVDPQVSVSYGTDNSIRMSRDGGTTWVTGTMTAEAVNLDFPGGYIVDVVTASFDFSGTPSGTDMQLEWATFNNKYQLLHAWYPEWGS